MFRCLHDYSLRTMLLGESQSMSLTSGPRESGSMRK